MYLLGYDLGSSSIKAALILAGTGEKIAVVHSPETEMAILSPQPGWAEQHPEVWWENVCTATKKLLHITGAKPAEIKGIGIAYQMHGLVCVGKNQQVLRPAIIWCDSRAVGIGQRAFDEIGHGRCLSHLLNSPGNFTASKLKWVKDNEPALFGQIDKFMLPGDYLALRLTGEAMTTASGLSEGTLWDFDNNDVADFLFQYYGFDKKLIPTVVPTFSLQGQLTRAAAEATGLQEGIPVAYRAGDQPNNALSLGVLNPGEMAATGGTSGVVYGITDRPVFDPKSRVNAFLHVNDRLAVGRSFPDTPGWQSATSSAGPAGANGNRIGILLCINGAGSQYAWLKKTIAAGGLSYAGMEQLASQVPVGSDGLRILPFGNGAERMLENRDPGAHISGLNFNRHSQAHLCRAALEGIAFSFVYGMGILKEMGLDVSVMRVGNDNLFQSAVFSNTIAGLMGCTIEVVETTGAVGAAKAAGVATGVYGSIEEAVEGNQTLATYQSSGDSGSYIRAYESWMSILQSAVNRG